MTELPILPLGQQSFPIIRELGRLYIDKTALIARMIQHGEGYFLSRPRRMGKSLLVSVLEAIFQGRRELFDGLAIADSGYAFKAYHVIRLDFGSFDARTPAGFEADLCGELNDIASEHNLVLPSGSGLNRTLSTLVKALAKTAPVVLLIDEYDLPLLRNLRSAEEARPFIDALSVFFTAVKAVQPYLRFTFVTGVSRFARTSMFSGMNHLVDISLQAEYSTLLGISDEEIDHYLLPFVRHLAKEQQQSTEYIRATMRQWYNGYRFCARDDVASVYNPFSLFSFLSTGRLSNHWFSTGTPTFAMQLIGNERFPVLDFEKGVRVTETILTDNFQLNRIDIRALLVQAGYLTISDYDAQTREYTLTFPNQEVRCAFFESLMLFFLTDDEGKTLIYLDNVTKGLRELNVEPLIEAGNILLGKLSHHLQRRDEAFYHALIYVMLRCIGISVESEKSGCTGRLDMAVRVDNKVYILEFKRDGSAAEAICQIRDKQYARCYDGEGWEIYLVGINVNSKRCVIDDWKMEQL